MHRPHIRILVVDDHAALRGSLVQRLTAHDDLKVVGEAGSGDEAVALAERLRPDVILMDVTMRHGNGLEATREIATAYPRVRVVGLSVGERESIGARMLRAGAAAYVEKAGPVEELVATIRRVSSPAGPGASPEEWGDKQADSSGGHSL